MTGKFPFVLQSYYRHLKPMDIHLWEKFIRANPGFFESVDYDFEVGDPPTWMNEGQDKLASQEKSLYARKIDVVGYIGPLVWLIEVKKRAGPEALGQVLAYNLMYRKRFGESPDIRLGVITNQCQNGYCEIFSRSGILCHHVGYCPQCQ